MRDGNVEESEPYNREDEAEAGPEEKEEDHNQNQQPRQFKRAHRMRVREDKPRKLRRR